MTSRLTPDTSRLNRAFASTREVLAAVRAEHLGLPTPCASWDVSALINHFIGSARWAAGVIRGDSADTEQDYTAGDFLGTYDDSIQVSLAAFGTVRAGAEAGRTFGGLSGAALMSLSTLDQFMHGWDLARAIGYATDLDPGPAAELLDSARSWVDENYRGLDGVALFGPVVEAPAQVGPADRLAAFLGRAL
jgi:uncharacterized protein (TIGR03086 family)